MTKPACASLSPLQRLIAGISLNRQGRSQFLRVAADDDDDNDDSSELSVIETKSHHDYRKVRLCIGICCTGGGLVLLFGVLVLLPLAAVSGALPPELKLSHGAVPPQLIESAVTSSTNNRPRLPPPQQTKILARAPPDAPNPLIWPPPSSPSPTSSPLTPRVVGLPPPPTRAASPPRATPPPACSSPWCARCQAWVDDPSSKFHWMWGVIKYAKKFPQEANCWDKLGGPRYFDAILAGEDCDRNWLEGALGSEHDRPEFAAPAPALLGFDESIVEFCSELIEETATWGDLNHELASRCVRANENVLRIIAGRYSWDMCQNLEWQLCAATGRLPGQDEAKMNFAFAPKELEEEWFEKPTSHPTYPCNEWWCPDTVYTVGDVFFAEVCVLQQVCRNSDRLFAVERGETFVCDLDAVRFAALAKKMQLAARGANKRQPPKPVGNPWFAGNGQHLMAKPGEQHQPASLDIVPHAANALPKTGPTRDQPAEEEGDGDEVVAE